MSDLFICLLEGGPPKVKVYDLCQKWILIWKARENKPSLFFFFLCNVQKKKKKQKIRKQVGCHIRETVPGNLKSYGPRDMPSEE